MNSSRIDNIIIQKIKDIDLRLYIIFISVFVFGLVAHGSRLFDYVYFPDGVYNINSVGATIMSGRWGLGITNKIVKFFTDGHNYESPLLLGVMTFILLSFFIYVVIRFLEINSKILIIALSGIMVTFPFFPSLFNFIYTAPFYIFAMLLSSMSVYIYCKYNNNYLFIFIAIVMFTFSIAIYQAIIPVVITLLMFWTLKIIKEDKIDNKYIIKSILYLLLSFVLYILFTLIICKITKVDLTSYRGISTLGRDSISNYVYKVINCYKFFLLPKYNYAIYKSIFPGKIIYVYYISLIMLAYFIIINFYKGINIGKNKSYRITLLSLVVICIPLAFNFIFFMTRLDDSSIYKFTLLSYILYPVFFVWNIDMIDKSKVYLSKLLPTASFIILLTIYSFVRYANACNLVNNLRFNKTKSYFEVMISQIKNTSGYNDDLKICFINAENNSDTSISDMSGFDDLIQDSSLIYKRNFIDFQPFLYNILGFNHYFITEDEFKDNEVIKNMPRYPEYGSIRIIDDVIVVKF